MRHIAIKLIRLILKISRRWVRILSGLNEKIDKDFDLRAHNNSVVQSTVNHNMKDDADEIYYTEQYWHHIQYYLKSLDISKSGCFLDLGCGQGRLTLPLAQWADGASITGIDLSKSAIVTAERELRSFDDVTLHQSDISIYLDKLQDESIDVIFFFEVSFFLPNYECLLKEMRRVLKPGGILFSSFRSRYFNALCCIQDALWDSTDMLLNGRSGRLFGSETYFNWSTGKEVKQLFTDCLGFELHDFRGIGCCSGIAGDPLAKIARPSLLSEYEKKQLMRMENELGKDAPDAGRYMFLVAEKVKTEL